MAATAATEDDFGSFLDWSSRRVARLLGDPEPDELPCRAMPWTAPLARSASSNASHHDICVLHAGSASTLVDGRIITHGRANMGSTSASASPGASHHDI